MSTDPMNPPTDRERPALSEGDQDIMASRDLATPTCSALEFLDSVAAVPMQDIDLSYLATNVLYARGSIAKEVRREAVIAIKTLRDILSSAKQIAGESSRDDPKPTLTQVESMTPENSPALAKAIHDLSVFAYRHAPDAEVAEWERLITTVTAELDACNAALFASPKPPLTQGGVVDLVERLNKLADDHDDHDLKYFVDGKTWVEAAPIVREAATALERLAGERGGDALEAAQGIEWFERTFGVPLGDMPGRVDVEKVRALAALAPQRREGNQGFSSSVAGLPSSQEGSDPTGDHSAGGEE